MSEILLYYDRPNPTTWVYMSSFLTIGLFFVFHRFWSIRNLDIVLLILLAPGLLMVHEGRRIQLMESESLVQQWRTRQPGQRPLGQRPLGPRAEANIQGLGSMLELAPVFLLTQTNQGDPNQTTLTDEPGGSESGDLNETRADGDANSNSGPAPQAGDAVEEADTLSVAGDQVEDNATGGGSDSDVRVNMVASEYDPLDIQRWGFIYLFAIEALLLIRMMLDPLMVRRPLLDPNLTTGGLNFIGISLFVFVMANVVTSNPRVQVEQGPELGPGYALMNMLPAIPTRPIIDQPGGAFPPRISELTPKQLELTKVAKTLAILAQLAIVAGIVLISNRHLANLRGGVGCATLYLLLPYTAQMTGRVDHALPAALLLWAVLCYRRPFLSGCFLGLAGGLVYYPLFLLPLWGSFYWQRGARMFTFGVLTMLAVLMLALSFDTSGSLGEHLQRMFGLLNPNRDPQEFRGIWALGWNPIWRLPVIVAFVILSSFFAIWPAQKNLGTLISGSAALMVASQFWHGYGGGSYIAWFLPLVLLAIFRPNLQDRVASKFVALRNPAASESNRGLEPV